MPRSSPCSRARDAVLIVDGAFLLVPALAEHWERILWIDNWRTMVARAMARDVAWVGSAERVRERYEQYWIPRHRHYEGTYRPRERADIVVDNDDLDRPRIVRMGKEGA